MQIVFYTVGNLVLRLSVRNDAVPMRQQQHRTGLQIYYD